MRVKKTQSALANGSKRLRSGEAPLRSIIRGFQQAMSQQSDAWPGPSGFTMVTKRRI